MAIHKEKAVRSLLTSYNESVGEGGALNVDAVCAALAQSGAGVPSAAAELSYEDVSAAGVPVALARAIAKLWRGEKEAAAKPEGGGAEMRVGNFEGGVAEFALAFGNVGALSDRVLLQNYEPLGRDDVVGELHKRSGGKPFIVFADNATLRIDVDRTLGVLQLLKQSVEVGDRTMVEGRLMELLRSGELPDLALAICPIHECHLVGEDEHCPTCARNWKSYETSVRELAWVHVQQVLCDVPEATDPALMQIHSALGNAQDPYWASAQLELQKRKATGQPIVLVKPLDRPARPAANRRR